MPYKHVTREEWIAGLRSGEYKQTTGATWRGPNSSEGVTEDCFCAFGVLAELAGVPRSVEHKMFHENRDPQDQGTFIPLSVYKHLRIDPWEVAAKNDGGYDFEQIANLLESGQL